MTLFIAFPLVTCAVFCLIAYARTQRQRKAVSPVRMAIASVVAQVLLAAPVGLTATWAAKAFHPDDDWYDIHGVSIAVVNLVAAPFVAVAVRTAAGAFERRRRYAFPGCCSACGYDLTGNVSGRCPECGVRITTLSSEQHQAASSSLPSTNDD